MKRIKFILTCLGAPSCMVSFEPEGAEHQLVAGDIFHVEVVGEGFGDLEISFTPDRLVVGAWDRAKTVVYDKAGNVLPT